MSKNDKTCGECKHFYTSDEGQCSLKDDWGFTYSDACPDFKSKIATNGDKIRQMNNTDLAEMLVYPVKPMNINGNIYYEFTSCLLLGKSYPMREQAVFLTERRLNAPADCVKQNGNHDTQADLCKVDNTESEVNNG